MDGQRTDIQTDDGATQCLSPPIIGGGGMKTPACQCTD